MKKHRGAIVGFGRVAEQAHVPGFRLTPGFEIAVVIDPSEERRALALAALPGARAYPDFAAAAETETKLDFADVATPPRFHTQAVTQALVRGLHVLCEKPLALSLKEAADLSHAARRSGHALFTVHNWKYAPLFRRHHVRLTISGHDHLFDHFVERYVDAGVKYRRDDIVTGGGGAPIYTYRGEPELSAYLAAGSKESVRVDHLMKPGATAAENPHHFLVIEVDADRLSVEVFGIGGGDYRPYAGRSRVELSDP